MILKWGKHELKVSKKDKILDNGLCYVLITQKELYRGMYDYPLIDRDTFHKLLRTGKIKLIESNYKADFWVKTDKGKLYAFTED